MLMRSAIVLLAVTSLAGAASAQGRPDVRTMDCGQVQALIADTGAVVLTTGRYTYDRYVANRQYCMMEETPVNEWLTTRDTNSCHVYRCELDLRMPRS